MRCKRSTTMRFALATVLTLVASVSLTACEDDEHEGDDDDAPSAAAGAFLPSDAERAELLGVLQSVFDGLRTGDGDLLRQALDPDVRMVYTQTDDQGRASTGNADLEGLIQRVSTASEPLHERMWDPEVRVLGDIATIWTPYDFYAGDTFSHCGVDVATLMRGADGWKIVALEWSRAQPPACELHPEGPPGG